MKKIILIAIMLIISNSAFSEYSNKYIINNYTTHPISLALHSSCGSYESISVEPNGTAMPSFINSYWGMTAESSEGKVECVFEYNTHTCKNKGLEALVSGNNIMIIKSIV